MRRGAEPMQQRRGLHVGPGLAVAGTAHRPDQRRIHETAGEGRRTQRGRDRGPQERRRGNGAARIGVEAREVAAGVKAGQPALDLGELRGEVDLAIGVAHDPCHGSHRRKAVVEHVCPRAARSPVRGGLGRGRRGARRHVRTVSLLQIRDLAGTRLRGQRRRGLVPRHSPAAAYQLPHAAGRGRRDKRQARPRDHSATLEAARSIRERAGPNRRCGELLGWKTTYGPRHLPRLPPSA